MKLINIFSVFIIFSGAFALKGEPIDFYFYYIYVVFAFPVLVAVSGLRLHRGITIALCVLLVLGLFQVVIGNNSLGLLMKQILGIAMLAFFFYYLLKANNFDWMKLFAIYMNIAKIVAIIAIVQAIGYLFGIRFLYDFSYIIPEHRIDTSSGFIRVSSILVEPAHYVTAMAPAIFVSLFNAFKKTDHFISRKMSFIIVFSVFLSFSMVGYLCLILSFIFLFKNPFSVKKIIVTAGFFVASVLVLYNTVDGIKSRIDGLVFLFIDDQIGRVNISSFTIFNNYTVATQNFLQHPLFGTGLGSHQLAFEKYAHKNVYDPGRSAVSNSLNKEDANSLLLRIISEIGLLGIVATFLFIFTYRINNNHFNEVPWVVSTSILILILIKLTREGNYFNHGFPFFLWIFYYIKKEYIQFGTWFGGTPKTNE